MNKLTKQEFALIYVFVLLGVLSALFLKNFAKEIQITQKAQEIKAERYNTYFNEIKLVADSTYIYDFSKNEVIFKKNEDKVLPIASLTKIMTARTFLDNFKNVDSIVINEDSLKQYGDEGLYASEKWKVEDIIKFMLSASSNDIAQALYDYSKSAGLDLVGEMNAKAKRLGYTNTHFYSPSGLDARDGTPTSFSTCADVTRMLFDTYSLYPWSFDDTTKLQTILYSMDGNRKDVKNTNVVVDEIPGILASKTGFTESAGGALVTLFKATNGDMVSACVLGSTKNDRFNDMLTIVDSTNKYLE